MCKWLNKTSIHKFRKSYFFNFSEKFVKNKSYKVFSWKKKYYLLERQYSLILHYKNEKFMHSMK